MPSTTTSSSRSPRPLPLEMLTKIFSYCDKSTLAAVLRVSTGTWEMVGPMLYDTVEVTAVDQLKSLFYADLDDQQTTERLRTSRSLLTWIRKLTLKIQSETQTARDHIEIGQPDTWSEDGQVPDDCSIEDYEYNGPRRLARAFRSWDLDSLVVLVAGQPAEFEEDLDGEYASAGDRLLIFFAAQIFPHLNPRLFTLRWTDKADEWRTRSLMYPHVDFVEHWNALVRIELDGFCLQACDPYADQVRYGVWDQLRTLSNGRLDIVFNLATVAELPTELWWAPEEVNLMLDEVLDQGGVTKRLVDRVNVRVVLKVKADGVKAVQEELKEVDEWMTRLVVVETVTA